MKQVRETSAGKSVSAYIVLRGDGTEVAKVHAYFADSGGVWVDVFNYGEGNPEEHGCTQARARGWGYDKFTAALAHLRIDGHTMTDHCGQSLDKPNGENLFPQNFEAPPGYTRANFISGARATDFGLPEGTKGWLDCCRKEGLKYLEDIGYRVIQAF